MKQSCYFATVFDCRLNKKHIGVKLFQQNIGGAFLSLRIDFVLSNSADPDAAFHLGVHCLSPFRVSVIKRVNGIYKLEWPIICCRGKLVGVFKITSEFC